LKSGLIRGVTFGESGMKRGVTFGENGLKRGVTFGENGLIRGITFGENGLIRGMTFTLITEEGDCCILYQSKEITILFSNVLKIYLL
jgi:hypothetical protein